MTAKQSTTYTRDRIRGMSVEDLNVLTRSLTKAELAKLVVYLSGYSPEGLADALNAVMRSREVLGLRPPRTAGAAVGVQPANPV